MSIDEWGNECLSDAEARKRLIIIPCDVTFEIPKKDMNTLLNIYLTLCKQGYCTDKGDVHSYIEVYEELLTPYRSKAKNVLEIGLFKGHSLRMWEQYFPCAVYGIDCSDQPHGGMADLRPMIKSGEHNIAIFDAENEDEVKGHFNNLQFDVIIEDASHNISQQLNLYRIFKEYIAPGGIYIIEDIDDIDAYRHSFETIDKDKTVEIIDRRKLKGRWDDVLVVIK